MEIGRVFAQLAEETKQMPTYIITKFAHLCTHYASLKFNLKLEHATKTE